MMLNYDQMDTRSNRSLSKSFLSTASYEFTAYTTSLLLKVDIANTRSNKDLPNTYNTTRLSKQPILDQLFPNMFSDKSVEKENPGSILDQLHDCDR